MFKTYQLCYHPCHPPRTICSSLGLLFNGIPGCIRTLLIGGQIPLTFIRGCWDLNKSLALYVRYGGSFFFCQSTNDAKKSSDPSVHEFRGWTSYGHFVTLNWSHTINRLSRLPLLRYYLRVLGRYPYLLQRTSLFQI